MVVQKLSNLEDSDFEGSLSTTSVCVLMSLRVSLGVTFCLCGSCCSNSVVLCVSCKWGSYTSTSTLIPMRSPSSTRTARPTCSVICGLLGVCSAFTVTPVLTSMETRRRTPELRTAPTFGMVIPDSATLALMMQDLTLLMTRLPFKIF